MHSEKLIYSLKSVPVLQNRVFNSIEQARSSATGDMRIVQNPETGLIYNAAFDPDLLLYDSNYNNEQSLSPAFQSHLSAVKSIVERQLGRQDLLEVGCGKAYFLELLRTEGFDVMGCDPTYEGTAGGIIKDFYKPGIGITQKNIILRHVLEHISDPVSFLTELTRTNQGGKIYVEVPCMDWIASHYAWFDLFYEHVNYFRLADLEAMFGRVYESGRIFGDQYLYVVADLNSIRVPLRNSHDTFALPADFRTEFSQLRAGVTNVVWGAASKGVIFSLLATRAGHVIPYVIDVNPAKQGKFLPLTGIEVISPDQALEKFEASTNVIVMNSNYFNEIVKMSRSKFSYSVADNE